MHSAVKRIGDASPVMVTVKVTGLGSGAMHKMLVLMFDIPCFLPCGVLRTRAIRIGQDGRYTPCGLADLAEFRIHG